MVTVSPNCKVTFKFLLRCFFTILRGEKQCRMNHIFMKFCILIHLHFGGNKIYVNFIVLALTSFVKTFLYTPLHVYFSTEDFGEDFQ